MKEQLFGAVEAQRDNLTAMADKIFDHPEYEGEEVMASGLLTDYLKDNDFEVEMGVGGFKTAFRAVYEHGTGGPVIGILCEYDALKGLGHGCGHHMQGPSCLGAAIALKNAGLKEPFKLVVYGTPAEETLGSKCEMIKNGCFKELDVAFMMHGAPNTCTDVKCLAQNSYTVTFKGKRAHAALAPDKGKSAFDALLVAFNGVEFLREHVPDDVRMHYTVEELPGPIEPVESWIMKMTHVSDEEKEQLLQQGEPFVKAMLRMGDELVDFCNSEFVYQGHCGQEAYLTFYDLRTCAEDVLELPEAHKYRVELIDTWDMTRTVLLENASGKTKLTLPGKEGTAVLARKVD